MFYSEISALDPADCGNAVKALTSGYGFDDNDGLKKLAWVLAPTPGPPLVWGLTCPAGGTPVFGLASGGLLEELSLPDVLLGVI